MLKYKYSLLGGNLTSIKINNIEKLYQPMEGSWSGQDVVIFPFIARLKDQTYSYNGKIYSMKNHGLARYNNFVLEKKTLFSDTLLFKSNEETKKQYPFDFELRVIYRRKRNKLIVTYNVKNMCDEIMPFGIGGHPAIKVFYEDNDTKNNYLVFDKEYELTRYTLEDSGSFITGKEIMGKYQIIELDKQFFKEYKTCMLDASSFNDVILLLKNGYKVKYHFHSKYLALWSHPTCGDYVCVEPWDSLPDFLNSDKDIMKKESLIHLDPHKEYTFSYSIEFIK